MANGGQGIVLPPGNVIGGAGVGGLGITRGGGSGPPPPTDDYDGTLTIGGVAIPPPFNFGMDLLVVPAFGSMIPAAILGLTIQQLFADPTTNLVVFRVGTGQQVNASNTITLDLTMAAMGVPPGPIQYTWNGATLRYEVTDIASAQYIAMNTGTIRVVANTP